ncbi:MAG: hypothetical protein OXN97_15970 [Bryobacterales bacterium]|nr:hypothetical protein [Bryobacterales bacterium]
MKSLTGAHDAQEIVEGWLDQLGFKHDSVEEEMDGYSWVLSIVNPVDEHFQVGWMDEWGALQIQAALEIGELQQKAFLLMSASDKLMFLDDVSARLANLALEDLIFPAEGEEAERAPEEITPANTPPGQIYMAATVLVDKPLYRSDFFAHYLRVRGALRSVSSMFKSMAMLRRWK